MISEFQMALIGIAVLVIAGIIVFNRVQERRYRIRAEKAFAADHPDILIQPSEVTRPARLEPSLGELSVGGSSQVITQIDSPDALSPRGIASGIHPDIDCVAMVLADAPVAPPLLWPFVARAREIDRTILWEVLVGGLWQPLDTDAPASANTVFRELRIAMQLSGRRGPALRSEIERFSALVNDVTAATGAVSQRVPLDEALARAKELDAFCAEADIEIAVNLIGKNGATFAPAKVRGCADAAGMAALASGEFALFAADGAVQFTLRNMNAAQAPGIDRSGAYLVGLTFALDVPRVAQSAQVLARMYDVAQQFAAQLAGEVVDDNRKPLSAAGFGMIRQAVEEICARMDERGIAPGSPIALRLFS
jgi:hypothetical protein